MVRHNKRFFYSNNISIITVVTSRRGFCLFVGGSDK